MKNDVSVSKANVSRFQARMAAFQARVANAAQGLSDQGIKPTVARIRAALGGASPNEVGPALKAWFATFTEAGSVGRRESPAVPGRVPPLIADLTRELWQRATAAAALEIKNGTTAQMTAARLGEIQGLRDQLTALRDQMERDGRAYGELRAQAARHEAMARAALTRAEQAEARERKLLRELGEVRQETTQLVAELRGLRAGGRRSNMSRKTKAVGQKGRLTPASRPTAGVRVKPRSQLVRGRASRKALVRTSSGAAKRKGSKGQNKRVGQKSRRSGALGRRRSHTRMEK